MATDTLTAPVCFGDGLFVVPPGDSALAWYCLHTKPRREKKVAAICAEHELAHYLPLRRSVKHYGVRRREHSVPHFPGYLFCMADEEAAWHLTCGGHLANMLRVHDANGLMRDLREVYKALSVSDEIESCSFLREGQRVRVVCGPFRGVEGLVSRRSKDFRVVLNVHFIQRALAIELDAADVEPA